MKLNYGKVMIEGGFTLALPQMRAVHQTFARPRIIETLLSETIQKNFSEESIRNKIRPGMKIAIGVGSRGITNLQLIVRCTVTELKALGAVPFIVPAMGSHGGATAEGQIAILHKYGIVEELVGAPVRATMDTVFLGKVMGDIEVYFDKLVYEEADGIIVISRIKPHTEYKGRIESGIVKMLAIGLGKHKGAGYLHRTGMKDFPRIIPAVGSLIMEKTPFLFGVGIVENAYHETAMLELVPKERLPFREEELLEESKRLMARLLPTSIDVLIVDEMGKDISGCGMDSNVIGRCSCDRSLKMDAPPIRKIVILGLTEDTKGNATGMGMADFTTIRMMEEVDLGVVYSNTITAIEIDGAKIPVIMANDREAIIAAIKTAGKRNFSEVTMVRIRNTLALDYIWVSENMMSEVRNHPLMGELNEPCLWNFDESNHLPRMNSG